MITRFIRIAMFALLLVLGAAGCAGVKPWEKAHLGSYLMRADRDSLDTVLSEHIHFTREAASGGRGVGGGGCGCN
jgi:hypothetical protein